jgi:hypothetical protein
MAAATSAETGTVLGDERRGNVEALLLDRVRIRDDRPAEGLARAGDRGEAGRDHPSGTGLRGADRQTAIRAEVEDDLRDGALVPR